MDVKKIKNQSYSFIKNGGSFKSIGLEILMLISGIIVGSIFDKAYDIFFSGMMSKMDITEKFISIISIFLVVIFLIVISLYLKATFEAVVEYQMYKIHFSQDVRIKGKIKRLAFQGCAAQVLNAKRSILVVGPHFDARKKDDTTGHDDYLENSVTEAIYRNTVGGLNQRNRFTYLRIAQVGEEEQARIGQSNIVSSKTFDNTSLASHIKEILEIKSVNQNSNIDIKIVVRKFVESFPSILIIDDRYVYFSLPSLVDGVAYDTVLGFEDVDGHIPRALGNMVRRMSEVGNCAEIAGVRD